LTAQILVCIGDKHTFCGTAKNLTDILSVHLNKEELRSLAERAKVIINCVGPYHIYSTPVVEACANAGTHYLDAYAVEDLLDWLYID
jgi:saccharopine dehydrogenase-like NADP-dependent oxidoreductase